jgi:hypothetical protein
MMILRKIVRLYFLIALATALGVAGFARASLEAHAPVHAFLSENALSISGKICLSQQVDEKGAPISAVHIHACAMCLPALDVIASIQPPTTIISKLDAPKKLKFELQPTLHVASFEWVSSHGPRAPPAFS